MECKACEKRMEIIEEHEVLAKDMLASKRELLDDLSELASVLGVILDSVDYTSGACRLNESVGGVLPKELIERAKSILGKNKWQVSPYGRDISGYNLGGEILWTIKESQKDSENLSGLWGGII